MNLAEITPDMRVTCNSRGDIAGTVLHLGGPDDQGRGLVAVAYDGGGIGWNYPEQLDALDETAPAPRLFALGGGRSGSVFWHGGDEYHVENLGEGTRASWYVTNATRQGQAALAADARTRKAAIAEAFTQLGIN